MSDQGGVRVIGPLERYAAGFADELAGLGYTRRSAMLLLGVLGHLSRWLAAEGLDAHALSAEQLNRFLATRRAAGYRHYLSPKGLGPLLDYLRALGVVAAEQQPPLDAAEALLERYRRYLLEERGLTAETVRGYVLKVRPFVTARVDAEGEVDLEGLMPADVLGYVLAESRRGSRGTAKLVVTALRSLLVFWHVDGLISRPLAQVVPAVAGWRLAGLPRGLEREQVEVLLASCDRGSTGGCRDFAILAMLVRLGMRRGEVAALELEDLDWRAGEVLVRGKGNRIERLPLPVDVGEAISDYLQHGRPASAEGRAVFVRVRAPHRVLSPGGVTAVVLAAAERAGLPPLTAHRLRHTAACELLRSGAPLVEIGQLLRHRSQMSTAIYAKVDRDRLRELARPWPGGAA